MNSKPLVSGIIIFLNEARFIEEAIASVFAQTYENWELLLVDDGSTDNSSAIAQSYARQYPEKVRYLEHENHQNQGMSASRNLGIRNAQGKYIALLDADDIWLPHKLQEQVAILESQPEAAMVYGRTQFWHSWTGNPEDYQKDSFTDLGILPNRLVQPPTLLTLFLEKENTVASTCSILIRREIVEELGRFEASFRDQFEDMVFYTKVFWQKSVYVSEECWDRYRQHSANSWVIPFKQGEFDLTKPNSAKEKFLNWMEAYLTQQNGRDTIVWQALQTELYPYRDQNRYDRRKRLEQLVWQVREGLVEGIKQQSFLASIYERVRIARKKRQYIAQVNWLKVSPVSDSNYELWGIDRDRYYLEKFLTQQAKDIQGHILEIDRNIYTHQFGGDAVTKSDILQVREINTNPTANHCLPDDEFDCIIFPQILPWVDDVPKAIKILHKSLKPRGVLLITFSDIDLFTQTDAEIMLSEIFPVDGLTIETYDNQAIAIKAVKEVTL
ncbi:MAG: glycosyltransferase [Hydrococcus sp. SU_1_0]|nr:glycosyltransferase [Hydrococcus sp. SU_1_0]